MAQERKLRVLWATDGSSHTEAAVPLLRQMVLPATEKLFVLSVAPHPVISPARLDPAYIARVTPAAKQKALLEARQIAEGAATLLDPDAPVEALTGWGHPIEEILRASNQKKVDLIVMAARGHSNLRIIMLGSVTQGVAQHTLRPLLIARPGGSLVRKVVFGYHGSSAAKKAFSFLNRLALPPDAELVLVTALEPFVVPEGTPPAYRRQALTEAHKINERRHSSAVRVLQNLAEQVRAIGRRVSVQVESGPAGLVLDSVARQHDADLIVVGSRRPTPQRHYLLGSTAEKLVRHAQTSVLVVR